MVIYVVIGFDQIGVQGQLVVDCLQCGLFDWDFVFFVVFVGYGDFCFFQIDLVC